MDVELLLPLRVAPEADSARRLAGRFTTAAQVDPDLGSVDVRFH